MPRCEGLPDGRCRNSAFSHVAVMSARASPAASVDVLDDAGQDGVCVEGAQMSTVIPNNKISESSTSQGPQGLRIF